MYIGFQIQFIIKNNQGLNFILFLKFLYIIKEAYCALSTDTNKYILIFILKFYNHQDQFDYYKPIL